MDANKVAIILASKGYACSAVGFITDNKVKCYACLQLEIMHNIDALVGREEKL